MSPPGDGGDARGRRAARVRPDTGDGRDADKGRDVGGPDADDKRDAGGSDADDGKPATKRRSRSAKARQDELGQRKADTGTRRGDPRAGFGKDPPPKGGRNKGGRGR